MIRIENVTKKINGIEVLHDINLEFQDGLIYGLQGENGSGKTMLLRLIAGLIIPSEGKVYINEQELHKEISFPQSVGIIIENMQLLPQYNAVTNLEILASIKKKATKDDIKDVLNRIGLKSSLKVKKYSLGMKQRLNIAQAVFEKPDIILLDEPTNALDSEGKKKFYNIMKEEKERGACIIIASHNSNDFEKLCDRSICISEGRILNE